MLNASLWLLAGIVVVFAITAVTGYFVAQEFAYMAVDRSRLTSLADDGDSGAARALEVTRRTSFMLSGAQLGITVTGLLVGFTAEPLIGQSLGTLFGGIGIPKSASVLIGGLVALLFATVVQMVFGELFPKSVAIARPEPVALWLSRSTAMYLRAFGWLIWIFDKASNLLLRAVGIQPVHDVEHSATARDLEHIVAESRESGDLPEELSVMLDRILDFPHRTVEHAMIPRSRVATVDDDETIGSVRQLMSEGHSRYPVLAADTDEILGVVQLVDLLASDSPDSASVTELIRAPLVLSHLQPLPDALAELRESRNQLACVIDEYGGFFGVLTMEDLAEELVGEITDEHDAGSLDEPSQAGGDGVWVMSGDIHVDEAERSIGADLPRGDYETVAGLLIAHNRGLPEVGDTFEIDLLEDPADLISDDEPKRRFVIAEVLAVASHVPSEVRITLGEADTEADVSGDDAKAAEEAGP